MTRLFDPFSVGFDRIFDDVEKLAKRTAAIKYPPYNITKTGNRYTIDMAVAGFKKPDIIVEHTKNILTVKGVTGNPLESEVDNTNTILLYRGIANRDFQHQFRVADNVEVVGADLADGMLSILLDEYTPEEQKPKRIMLK